MTKNTDQLSRSEELGLAQRYLDDADPAALARLVMGQLKQVEGLARRYRGYGLDHSDMVSEGMVGLVEAAKRFQPERGLRFFTYARHWAKARMLAFVLKHWSIVGAGTGAAQSKLFFQLRRRHAALEAKHGGGSPRVLESLAAEFGVSAGEAEASLHRLRRRDSSLNSPLRAGADATFLDLLPANDEGVFHQVLNREMRAEVRGVVDSVWNELSEREQLILRERMMAAGDALSLAEIGRQLGITRERVRQIEAGIKDRLRTRILGSESAAVLAS